MTGGLLLSSLMLGVLGSVHCTSMCSGLMCQACGSQAVKSQAALLLGRALSYSLAGVLLGGGASFLAKFMVQGGALAAFGHLLQWAAVLLALLMLLAPQLSFFQVNSPSQSPPSPLVKRSLKPRSRGFYLGLLWVGMPCGLLQTALMLAWFSGSALLGGLSMALFAVVSGLWILGLGRLLAGALQRWPMREVVVRRLSGALLLVGLLSIHLGSGAVGAGDGFFCLPQF